MPSAESYFGSVWIARLLLQRGMAAIYLVAFVAVVRQFKPLLGERGLLPVPTFLEHVHFREAPSLFHWRYSDRLLDVVAWLYQNAGHDPEAAAELAARIADLRTGASRRGWKPF